MTPLPLTGGSAPRKTQVLIDWISVTFPRSTQLQFPDQLTRVFVPCRPFNAYNVGSKFEDGRIVLEHTTRPEMGKHVICSGDTLRNMPIEPLECLKFFLEHGAKVTRLDIAIDALNHGLKPEKATKLIKRGKVKTNAKQFPAWIDPTTKGYTQYVGKKSSEVCCRIYNKAAEMGINADHTRIECVFASERAQMAARQAVQFTDLRSLVVGFVTFEGWAEWENVMGDATVKIPADRKTSQTRKWLLDAAAKALAKECLLSDGDEFQEKFINAVEGYKVDILSKMKQA